MIADLIKNNVELFCIGTELSFASQKTDKWKELIQKVKTSYDGKLTYAANWDNYKNIKFWDDLDFVGIDAYFPLSYTTKPDLEELKNGWNKWSMEIENFFTSLPDQDQLHFTRSPEFLLVCQPIEEYIIF